MFAGDSCFMSKQLLDLTRQQCRRLLHSKGMLVWSEILTGIVRFTGRATSWLILLLVLLNCLVVLLRYLLQINFIPLQEGVLRIHGIFFMLGIPYAMLTNSHVRVDIFYQHFKPHTKQWIEMLVGMFFVLPLSIFLFWFSWDYVIFSWRLHEGSSESGGLPGVYLLKSILLVMPGLMFLQGLHIIQTNLRNIVDQPLQQPSH